MCLRATGEAKENAEPQGKQRESLVWVDYASGLPNDKEVLVYSLMVVYSRSSVADLKEWVSNVRRHNAQWESEGAYGLPAVWKPSRAVNTPKVFEVLVRACADRVWHEHELESIANAMALWDGPEKLVRPVVGRSSSPLAVAECASEHETSRVASLVGVRVGGRRWRDAIVSEAV